MTPSQLHEACHQAMWACPQFRGYDDDTYFTGFGEFSKIPRKGYAAVMRFWREETDLFDCGYDEALPAEARKLFEIDIDQILNSEIRKLMDGEGRECKDCGEVNPAEIHTCSPQKR